MHRGTSLKKKNAKRKQQESKVEHSAEHWPDLFNKSGCEKWGGLLGSKRRKICDQVQMQEWEIVAKNVLGYWENVNKKYLMQPLDENMDVEC